MTLVDPKTSQNTAIAISRCKMTPELICECLKAGRICMTDKPGGSGLTVDQVTPNPNPNPNQACDRLEELRTKTRTKYEECVRLPLSCSGRGTCNSEGHCECWGANLRDNCEEEPYCRFWDVNGVNGSDWSDEGVKLVVFDRGSGGGVCATSHLTDFAIISDVLARPDEGFVFFEDLDLDLDVHLPRPISLEEIIARQDPNPNPSPNPDPDPDPDPDPNPDPDPDPSP